MATVGSTVFAYGQLSSETSISQTSLVGWKIGAITSMFSSILSQLNILRLQTLILTTIE
jgi:hypothetical protein